MIDHNKCQHLSIHPARVDGSVTVCFDCRRVVAVRSVYYASGERQERQYREALEMLRAQPRDPLEATPLPTRPGTTWDGARDALSGRCASCGKDYNSHGAPEDVARELGVPEDRRHLVCPAPDEAWENYRAARRRAEPRWAAAEILRLLRSMAAEQREEAVKIVEGELRELGGKTK